VKKGLTKQEESVNCVSTQILALGNNNASPLFFYLSKLSFLQSMILVYHAIEVVCLASGHWITIIIINHHVNYQTFT